MNIWFTADQHFFHYNIIKYCDRPFYHENPQQALRLMHNTIIENFNSLVKPNDLSFHVGDFSFSRNVDEVSRIVNKLHGKKILILGSHDNLRPFQYVAAGFSSVHTKLNIYCHKLWLVHDPAVSVTKRDEFWVCGHVHTLFRKHSNVVNVGVDVWNFEPVNLEIILSLKEGENV